MGVATFVEFLNPLAFDVTYVDESRIVDRDGAGRPEFPVAVSLDTPSSREFTLGTKSLDSLGSFIEDVDPIARGINGDVSRRLELAVSVSCYPQDSKNRRRLSNFCMRWFPWYTT